jgi:hypothetical protein
MLAIDGETVIEHLAAVEDFCVALAMACRHEIVRSLLARRN